MGVSILWGIHVPGMQWKVCFHLNIIVFYTLLTIFDLIIRHRALGVHISFVRSVSMDSWNQKQIDQMRKGGNEKCIEFLKQYNVPKTMPIQQKYNTPAALLYKDRLQAEMEGRPLPTELPTSKSNGNNGSQTIQV